MSEVFFTSDTHFNHVKCQELFRNDRFSSLEEMNETIIDNWNARVSRSDRVYHLGDVALGSAEDASKILKRLNGQIYLIKGNHDRVAEHKLCASRFVWIRHYHSLTVGTQKIYLLHYAMRTWNCMHHGSWHLYGHSHGSLPELPGSLSFDIGVDSWDYFPVSFDEVAAKMSTKVFEPVDHHTADVTWQLNSRFHRKDQRESSPR